jgi:hypothetical protein
MTPTARFSDFAAMVGFCAAAVRVSIFRLAGRGCFLFNHCSKVRSRVMKMHGHAVEFCRGFASHGFESMTDLSEPAAAGRATTPGRKSKQPRRLAKRLRYHKKAAKRAAALQTLLRRKKATESRAAWNDPVVGIKLLYAGSSMEAASIISAHAGSKGGKTTRWDNRETALAALMGWTPAPATPATMARRGVESKGRTVKAVGLFATDYATTGY